MSQICSFLIHILAQPMCIQQVNNFIYSSQTSVQMLTPQRPHLMQSTGLYNPHFRTKKACSPASGIGQKEGNAFWCKAKRILLFRNYKENHLIKKAKEDDEKKETKSIFKFVSEMTREERKVHEQNQEEEAKADGSWCYECNDLYFNKIVLKRHIHNDHNRKVHHDINISYMEAGCNKH